MRKYYKRIISLILCAALILGLSGFASADASADDVSSQTQSEEQSVSEDEESSDIVEEETVYSSLTTVDEDGDVIESITTQETTTTDSDGNTSTEVTEETDDTSDDTGSSESEDTSGSDSDGDDTGTSDDGSDDSSDSSGDDSSGSTQDDDSSGSDDSSSQEEEEEVTLVSTKTSYALSFKVTTTATSSSDSSVRSIKVTKPKLTTTTTKTYSDGTTTSSSKTTTYGLTVQVNVNGKGWVTASKNSAGTAYTYKAASGKYIQAVRITPSDNLKSAMKKAKITFIYRAKTKYFGTLGWAKAGYSAGTSGNSCPMTGLTLKIISTSKLSSYSTKYRYITKPTVKYKTKTTGSSSYSSAKTNGSTSGKTSSGTSIGSVAIKLDSGDFAFSGSIKYSVRTSKSDSSSNWSSWKKNYSTAGSKNSKIKAIKISLTGDMADKYNVYYRVYVSGYGWLGWAKNGEKAGTKNVNYNISAIQVKLVPKGQSAPGSTSNHFISSANAKLKMMVKAQNYSSSSKYLILVDTTNCKVGIFTGKKNNWTLKYYWSCCVGKKSTPTIKGSYTVGIKLYSFGESKGYSCYYATQISGNYLFHSVLYYPYSDTIKDGTMGKAVSHGCVRLTRKNAKWIYKNIPTGTKIFIY